MDFREELRTALSTPVITAGFKAYGKKAPYFMDFLSSAAPSTCIRLRSSPVWGLPYIPLWTPRFRTAAETALARGLARLEANNPGPSKGMEPDKKLQGAVDRHAAEDRLCAGNGRGSRLRSVSLTGLLRRHGSLEVRSNPLCF